MKDFLQSFRATTLTSKKIWIFSFSTKYHKERCVTLMSGEIAPLLQFWVDCEENTSRPQYIALNHYCSFVSRNWMPSIRYKRFYNAKDDVQLQALCPMCSNIQSSSISFWKWNTVSCLTLPPRFPLVTLSSPGLQMSDGEAKARKLLAYVFTCLETSH